MALRPSKEMENRLKNMLTRDKMGVGQGFLTALSGDLNRLLGDYFSLDGEVKTEINPLDDGTYEIKIVGSANKIKAFSSTSELMRK